MTNESSIERKVEKILQRVNIPREEENWHNEFDECPWCESEMDSESDNHFGTEYSYMCERCEGVISMEITHVVRAFTPPSKEQLTRILEVIQEDEEEAKMLAEKGLDPWGEPLRDEPLE
jgi:hypothetical protein